MAWKTPKNILINNKTKWRLWESALLAKNGAQREGERYREEIGVKGSEREGRRNRETEIQPERNKQRQAN